jgi:hypothetical protein
MWKTQREAKDSSAAAAATVCTERITWVGAEGKKVQGGTGWAHIRECVNVLHGLGGAHEHGIGSRAVGRSMGEEGEGA